MALASPDGPGQNSRPWLDPSLPVGGKTEALIDHSDPEVPALIQGPEAELGPGVDPSILYGRFPHRRVRVHLNQRRGGVGGNLGEGDVEPGRTEVAGPVLCLGMEPEFARCPRPESLGRQGRLVRLEGERLGNIDPVRGHSPKQRGPVLLPFCGFDKDLPPHIQNLRSKRRNPVDPDGDHGGGRTRQPGGIAPGEAGIKRPVGTPRHRRKKRTPQPG
jgi:hypothetical protein